MLVLCTVPDAGVGAKIARGLVEARLAACVNLVPGLRSIYVWQGQIHDEPEVQMLIKSRGGLLEAIERVIKASHPYEVPEILALPIEEGSREYLAFLEQATGGVDP